MIWAWLWIGIMLLACVLEAVTDKRIAIWFIPGALIAAIIDFFPNSVIFQICAFSAITVLGVLFGKKILNSVQNRNNSKTDFTGIVGERCVVIEKIDTFAGRGHVRIKGQVWSAKGLCEDDVFDEGEVLQIVALEGVKLICKRI